MPIVGTAGHVDHGKSTLVLALTGRDPDRWDEEKRRGLTIDLGFAWTTLPVGDASEAEAAFVDVPGHERFIRNMLAGIEAVDVALLVVAADEGWMPQSEEHLAVLDLLDVRHGVVAITKADRVDPDLAELAMAEVEERLAGSSLAGAVMVRVAAPLGEGVEEVRQALGEAVVAAGGPRDEGRARLWIDRAFTIAGAGTVVTGTLLDGPLRAGDQVAVWPGGQEARVRGLQSHERRHQEVAPGNRVAVNLVGVEREQAGRGAMLGLPGQWRTTDRMLVMLRTARYLDEPLAQRGAYHLHLGSGAWPVDVRVVGGDRISGSGAALLRLPEPLPVRIGDRFVLRDVGRRLVVAGGRVLDPAPSPRTRTAQRSVPALSSVLDAPPDERASALLAVRGAAPAADLEAWSGGGRPPEAVMAGDLALSPTEADRITAAASDLAEAYHGENPLRDGMPKASLASRLGIPLTVLEALVAGDDRLRDERTAVAAAAFRASFSEDDEAAWKAARSTLEEAGLTVPRAGELGLGRELLHALVRRGELVEVAGDLVYLPWQLEELQAGLAGLAEPFTVAAFRDGFGLTRRYAVPLLEWLDRTGVTVREGDLRRIRRPEPDRPGAPGARPR